MVVGGTGATGRLLVRALVERGRDVLVIARNPQNLPTDLRDHPRVRVVAGTVLGMSGEQLGEHLKGCDSIASCLGHSLTARGIFGPPRKLVRDTLRRLCDAVETPARVVLMSSTGCRDRTIGERVSLAESAAIALIRALIPPHADNEAAMAYLHSAHANASPIGWAIVRPDGLTNEEGVTRYDVHPSPTRSAIFNAGKTSRVNVADFMARLLCDDALFGDWRGKAPVLYNAERVTPVG